MWRKETVGYRLHHVVSYTQWTTHIFCLCDHLAMTLLISYTQEGRMKEKKKRACFGIPSLRVCATCETLSHFFHLNLSAANTATLLYFRYLGNYLPLPPPGKLLLRDGKMDKRTGKRILVKVCLIFHYCGMNTREYWKNRCLIVHTQYQSLRPFLIEQMWTNMLSTLVGILAVL